MTKGGAGLPRSSGLAEDLDISLQGEDLGL